MSCGRVPLQRENTKGCSGLLILCCIDFSLYVTLPPTVMAKRLLAQIPTALTLLLFVSKLTHQGREKASHTVRDGERDCRRGQEADISAPQASPSIKLQLRVLTSKDLHSSVLSGQLLSSTSCFNKTTFSLHLYGFGMILFIVYISALNLQSFSLWNSFSRPNSPLFCKKSASTSWMEWEAVLPCLQSLKLRIPEMSWFTHLFP